MVLLGGGGVGAFFLLSDNGSSSASPSTSAKPSGPPDKYTTMPTCVKIEEGVTNMPPLEPPKGQERASTSATDIELYSSSCNWYKYQEWSASVTMYLSKSTQPGSGAGEGYAKAGYENAYDDGGEAISNMEKATKAGYININSEGQCSIKFYQGNIEAQIIVSGSPPAAASSASMLAKTCFPCVSASGPAKLPSGRTPSWPARKTISHPGGAADRWLYRSSWAQTTEAPL